MKPNILFLFCLFILTGILSFDNANAQMFWNQGCSFAGSTSSYVAVRNSPELDITGSFTIEAWVNPVNVTSPSFQIILQKRDAGADGYTLYLSNGKVAIRTGATTRLTGRQVIPSNTWSHIAGTYNSATNTFVTYVNGSYDTGAVVAAAAPPSNSDSIWIGKGSNSPFEGVMDEVRIWNKALSNSAVDIYRRTSLGSSTGLYSGLVMSLTFQDNDNSGTPFSLVDWSGNSNTGFNRGATAFDMSNRPLQTIQTNDCIELDGSQDYLSAADAATVSPNTQLTLSAWIFMRSYANSVIIHKGGAAGGALTDYRLGIVGRKLIAGINGNFSFLSDDTIPLHRWTHVAFTYLASLGAYQYHINGQLVYQGTNAQGNITNGTDSLYIGGTPSLTNFDGYIDEVRIIPDVQYTETINQNMFKSIDLSNGGAGSYAVYNLDGYAYNNNNLNPLLRFRGNASFAHCGSINDQPQSPMNRADNLNFQSGFYQKAANLRIPATGFSGSITDSLKILLNESISDVNVFVALNHNEEQQLDISLINPSGNVVQLYNDNSVLTNADHVTTIFDDNADSSLNDLRYVSFSPRIKPYQSINSALGGSASGGYWKLNIRDIANSASSDTGMLYGWGIQINNRTTKPYLLNANAFIEGFYNPATNLTVRDTIRFYLRNTALPYAIIDSSKVRITNTGFGQFSFPNASAGSAYYLHLNHRNSIETWSSIPVYFDPLTFETEYSFLNPSTVAYGSNLTKIDNLPPTFGIWGADVDQDGIVDASDVSIVDNDAFVGLGGYVRSDVTGDNFVDAQDQSLADNNSAVSVTKIVPPGAGPLTAINPEVKINTDFVSGDPNLQSGNSDVKSLERERKYPENEK